MRTGMHPLIVGIAVIVGLCAMPVQTPAADTADPDRLSLVQGRVSVSGPAAASCDLEIVAVLRTRAFEKHCNGDSCQWEDRVLRQVTYPFAATRLSDNGRRYGYEFQAERQAQNAGERDELEISARCGQFTPEAPPAVRVKMARTAWANPFPLDSPETLKRNFRVKLIDGEGDAAAAIVLRPEESWTGSSWAGGPAPGQDDSLQCQDEPLELVGLEPGELAVGFIDDRSDLCEIRHEFSGIARFDFDAILAAIGAGGVKSAELRFREDVILARDGAGADVPASSCVAAVGTSNGEPDFAGVRLPDRADGRASWDVTAVVEAWVGGSDDSAELALAIAEAEGPVDDSACLSLASRLELVVTPE